MERTAIRCDQKLSHRRLNSGSFWIIKSEAKYSCVQRNKKMTRDKLFDNFSLEIIYKVNHIC